MGKRAYKKIFCVFLILIGYADQLSAQMVNEGKEFFFSCYDDGSYQFELVSKYNTTVNFHFYADPTEDFTVDLVAGEPVFVDVEWAVSSLFSGHTDGAVDNKSLHLCAGKKFMARAVQAPGAAIDDGSLLYPVFQPRTFTTSDHKDTFFVLNAGLPSVTDNIAVGFPGTIVVAHYDSVVLEMLFTQPMGEYPAEEPVYMTLNKGETFTIGKSSPYYPVGHYTGSRISVVSAPAGNPVSVISSTPAQNIPWPHDGSACCADYLLEQILPVYTNDTLYHIVPFMMAEGIPGGGTVPAVIKALSYTNDNNVYLDGELVATLGYGQTFDTIMYVPGILRADHPVSLHQFAPSMSVVDTLEYGDPDQLLVLSLNEQWFLETVFHPFPGVWGSKPTITNLILITESSTTSVLLDGEEVIGEFNPFSSDPGYLYAHIVVPNDESHHLLSDNGIVGYISALSKSQGGVSYGLGGWSSPFADTSTATTIAFCDTITLYGRVGADGYLWSDGGATYSEFFEEAGTYWVTSYFGCGEITDTFILVPPDTNVDLYNEDTMVCKGAVLELLADDLPGYVYEWVPAEGISDPTSPVTALEALESHWVTLNISYPGCLEEFSRSFYLEVRDTPVIESITAVDTICWGGGAEAVVSVPGADEYYSYLWTPPDGVSDPASKDVILSPELNTTYYIKVNSGAEGCEITDSVHIWVIPGIDLINNDTVLCSGTSIPIGVDGSSSFDYYWTPEGGIDDPHIPFTVIAPIYSGWVTITASREGCADMRDSFYIDLQPVPAVNAGTDDTVCGGVPYPLFAAVDPPYYELYTYSWTPGHLLDDSTVKHPWFTSFTASQELILTVATPAGCTGRDTVMLTVIPDLMEVNISDTGYCPGDSIQLEASAAESYLWLPSGGLSSDSVANPIASPDETTVYMVIGNTQGCLDTQFVAITVYPNAVTYMPDSVTIFSGEEIEIPMEANASYFSWYPPEGLSDIHIGNPIASPGVRTRYFVHAITEHGCSTEDSIDVVVDPGYVFDVPNAFVPGNHFSANGKFKILKRGEVSLRRFEIFDRWGVKVFETTDIEEGWDGTYRGIPQPLGVYMYIIVGKLPGGVQVQLAGNLTLIR